MACSGFNFSVDAQIAYGQQDDRWNIPQNYYSKTFEAGSVSSENPPNSQPEQLHKHCSSAAGACSCECMAKVLWQPCWACFVQLIHEAVQLCIHTICAVLALTLSSDNTVSVAFLDETPFVATKNYITPGGAYYTNCELGTAAMPCSEQTTLLCS